MFSPQPRIITPYSIGKRYNKVGKINERDAYYHRLGLLNKQRYGYTEGYRQALDDMTQLMGRYATGKNFTRSCDAVEAHLEVLKDWSENQGGNKPVPTIYRVEPPKRQMQSVQIPKKPIQRDNSQVQKPKPVVVIKKKRPVLHLNKSV